MEAKDIPVDDPNLKRLFSSELEALKDRPFTLQTDAVTAWAILCQIQLALRHPKNTGPTADIARRVAQEMINSIAPPGTALWQLAQMGWDRRYDVDAD